MTYAPTVDHDAVLEQAAEWMHDGRDVALATVVQTWGSAPRPAGSQLVVDSEGNFLGSVSGGCIEGAVVQEAVETIGDGQHRILEFGISNSEAWEVGLTCGGKIRILVEKLD